VTSKVVHAIPPLATEQAVLIKSLSSNSKKRFGGILILIIRLDIGKEISILFEKKFEIQDKK